MKWLKKFFKKSKTKEISINELKEDLKKRTEDIRNESKTFAEGIKQTKKDIDSALEALKQAKLEEKNQQIISRVLSNRDSYIKQTKRLLENIAIPEEISIQTLEDFLTNSTSAIKEFITRSAKSFQITQFLIGKELAIVSDKIKNFTNKLKQTEDKVLELKTIENIQNKIAKIKENKEKKKEIKKEIEILEKEMEKLNTKKKEKESKKEELEKSPAYEEYQKLKEKEKQIQENILVLKSKIINLFSPLQKALRKYSKISLDPAIIDKYIQNPYTALMKDKEIKISKILQGINIDSLDIKGKEDKIKKAITETNKELLMEMKEKDLKLGEELKKTKEKLSKTNILEQIGKEEKEIIEISYRLNEKEQEILKKKEYIKIDKEKYLKEEIQTDYLDLTKEKIIIS